MSYYRPANTEFGPIGRVSLAYFMQHIVPPLPDDLDVDEVMKALRRASKGKRSLRHPGPFAQNGRWRGFATKSPSGDSRAPSLDHRTKEEGFKYFPSILTAISKVATSMLKNSTTPRRFVQKINPAQESPQELYPADTLPDAYIVPRGDVAVSDAASLDALYTAGW